MTMTFDDSTMSRTIVTDFQLVCDRLPLLPTVASSYMAGVSHVREYLKRTD